MAVRWQTTNNTTKLTAMTTNQILAVVMSVLMISTCVISSRTKKNGANNLFSMLMLGIGSAVLGILTWRNPFWWMLGVQAYAFIGLWIFVICEFGNNERFLSRSYRARIRKWRIPMIVCTASAVLAVSILQIVNVESWWVYVEYSPAAACCAFVLLVALYDTLKEI